MNKLKLITVGSDPEFFIQDQETQQYISSEGIVGGTKDFPIQITDHGHGVQEDNVMAEITIPPVTTAEDLKNEVDYVINYLNEKLSKINPNYKIVVHSAAQFSEEQLNTDQAQTVGCSPDYNAWLQDMNPKVDVVSTNTRWAGGHIHIGYEESSVENTEKLVKAFDMFIGLPAVVIDPNDDRKKVYGTAGRFRFTSYGFEYRTLSNFWLSDIALIEFIFDGIKKAFDYVNSGKEVPEEVREIIDTVDKKRAIDYMKKVLKINTSKLNINVGKKQKVL
jgi:hypothetical protein